MDKKQSDKMISGMQVYETRSDLLSFVEKIIDKLITSIRQISTDLVEDKISQEITFKKISEKVIKLLALISNNLLIKLHMFS